MRPADPILVVEDESKTAGYLRKGLMESGFTVDLAEEAGEIAIVVDEQRANHLERPVGDDHGKPRLVIPDQVTHDERDLGEIWASVLGLDRVGIVILDPATTGIADELSRQYSLRYPAATAKRDGQWHSIRVEVANGEDGKAARSGRGGPCGRR